MEFQFLNVVLQQKYGTMKLPIDPEVFLQHAKNLLATERVVPHEEWVMPPVGSNKSLLHSRIAYSQVLVLQELLLWGGFERVTPGWRKMSQAQIIQRVLQLAKEKFTLIPRENEYNIKGLPQITVGSEMEHHNPLTKKIATLVALSNYLIQGFNYLSASDIKKAQVKYAQLIKWFEKLHINPQAIIENVLLYGCEKNPNRHNLKQFYELPVLGQCSELQSFSRIATGIGALRFAREDSCQEAITLPSLHPLLPLHDLGLLYSSEITNPEFGFHVRFLGFDFKEVYPHVTDGLLLGFGSGLLDPHKKLPRGCSKDF